VSGRLQIKVQGGSSDRTTIELASGSPVEPFSVGTAASWVVAGPGVAPTHAYLYFDGTTLYVACAPGAVVRSASTIFTTDWTPVEAPCEIQIGGVRLAVQGGRPAPGPLPPLRAPEPQLPNLERLYDDDDDDDDAPTQYHALPPGFTDPNAALAAHAPAAHHRPEPVERAPQSDRTRVLPPREEPRPARPERPAPPSVPPPTSEGATVVQPLEEFLDRQKASPPSGDPELPDTHKRPLGAPLPAAGAPPPARSSSGAMGVIINPGEATGPGQAGADGAAYPPAHQQPPAWGGASGMHNPYAYPQQPNQPGYAQHPGAYPQMQAQQGYPPMPGHPPMQAGPMQAMGMGAAYPGPPGAPAPTGKKGPLDELVQAWKSAPLPRKITYVIAPFAIIGFFIIFFAADPAPPPRTSKTAKSAKLAGSGTAPAGSRAASTAPPIADAAPAAKDIAPAADAASPAEVASAPAAAMDAGAPEPEADAAPPKLAPGEKLTKERRAVDAVVAGDYAKAIELYEELARENPKNPAFRTAAETLKRKRGK
jgi:hypothetical protein